jgi:hypothetical protein
LEEGQSVGTVSILFKDREIATSDLITLTAVEAREIETEPSSQESQGEETTETTEEEISSEDTSLQNPTDNKMPPLVDPQDVDQVGRVLMILTLVIIVIVLGALGYRYGLGVFRSKRRAKVREQRQHRRRFYDK